jgi:hypothetical protein
MCVVMTKKTIQGKSNDRELLVYLLDVLIIMQMLFQGKLNDRGTVSLFVGYHDNHASDV